MSVIVWDQVGEKNYETGVDHGVLYLQDTDGSYPAGVAWNGLTSINENPSGAEITSLYADNIKYLNLMSAEEFGMTIEAYTYPDEFKECDGSMELAPGIYAGQQNRKSFGMVYRTIMGNDTEGQNHGYKLHLVYGLLAQPSGKQFSTVNDSPDAINFSWEAKATPAPISTAISGKTPKPTATIEIVSTAISSTALKAIEEALFGTASTAAYLPSPDEVLELIKG